MKKTLRYTSLSALVLLATLTLAACGGNAEKTTAFSSKEASSSKVTKESSSKTEASQKEEQKSETSPSSSASTQTDKKEEKKKTPEAYAKFLGTWENYAGTTATVTADGIVTIQSSKGTFQYEMGQVEEKDGYYSTGIHLVDGGEGARLIFTPAGVANELTGTDGSQDVLAIGQSPSDKDSHFYRN